MKKISQQLSSYSVNIFDKYLCAFRKGHGCRTVLLRLLEDWKEASDKVDKKAMIKN